jgi:hypothetical protein
MPNSLLLPVFARAAAFVADSGWSSGAPVSGAAKAARFVDCSFKEAKTVQALAKANAV